MAAERKMNQEIEAATSRQGIEYVDTWDSFEGHEACAALGGLIANVDGRGTFHPTRFGQEVLAQNLACYLDGHPRRRPEVAAHGASTQALARAPGTVSTPDDC